ncbi:hypothetical protein BAUCODRAFT_150730 [Baudoinia panamericana UAMH 10762]|uniref:Uncharacterized protein n=1 Tax=Baudoinia panamericana (strain UAMH 10762) TaxID=717646 RepID=M2LGZ9_BAUPA|nr:uncharacterized protein BAUCODRAFT_150730 [Baudoinia panamericana UAMH 10762]EMC93397.1 hypothetical protein BAUCODRAFT_150730 [Baudoinia panamericana UAMH 10762]
MAFCNNLSPFEASRPRPTLQIPEEPATRSHPRLLLQRDDKLGYYQIQRIAGAHSASALSLRDWRSVDWVTRDLVESQHSPSSDTNRSDEVLGRITPQRRGIARLAAWVKRSGRGIILRLRGQNDGFTDLHLISDDWRDQDPIQSPLSELDGSPITEICSSPIIELPRSQSGSQHTDNDLTSYQGGASELRGSEVSSELPASQRVVELDAPFEVGATDASFVNNTHCIAESEVDRTAASEKSERTALPSRAGTIDSRLSGADTLVGCAGSELTHDMDIVCLSPEPIVRALTVSRVVKHRHRSPQMVDLLGNRDKGDGADANKGRILPRVNTSGVINPSQQHPRVSGTGVLTIREAGAEEKQQASNVQQTTPWIPGRHVETANPIALSSTVQAVYGITLSALVYQQDLHAPGAIAKDHTSPDSPPKLFSPGTPDPQLLRDLVAKLCATKQPVDDGASDKVKHEAPHTALAAAHCPPTEAEPDEGGIYASKAIHPYVIEAKPPQQPLALEQVLSPVSPLTTREKSEPVRESRFVPITPLTPHNATAYCDHIPATPVASSVVSAADIASNALDAKPLKDGQSGSTQYPLRKDGTLYEQRDEESVSPTDTSSSPLMPATQQQDVQFPDFGVKHLADLVEYQSSTPPKASLLDPPTGISKDDKILMKRARFMAESQHTAYVGRKAHLQRLNTDINEPSDVPQLVEEKDHQYGTSHLIVSTGRAQPQTIGLMRDIAGLLVSGITDSVIRSAMWLQRHVGQEPPVPGGHVRVRWTCNCGEHLYDDFIELRAGAAAELEAVLNKERPQPYSNPRSGSYSTRGSFSQSQTPNSSHPSSAGSSWSSISGTYGPPSGQPYKSRSRSRTTSWQHFPPEPQQYLLTCINESRNTPKVFNIPLHDKPVQTGAYDQLADALQERYAKVNKQWYRRLRLRGLTSIEFVQFYMHKNRFADIRMCPDVPKGAHTDGYEFEPSDLLPPVGGRYLLHLFKHPHEYDGERVAYANIPKKTERLDYGIGWGIVLTEGFLPERVWLCIMLSMILFSLVFAIVWTIKMHDIQGAFGVASFTTTLAFVVVGFAQACLG